MQLPQLLFRAGIFLTLGAICLRGESSTSTATPVKATSVEIKLLERFDRDGNHQLDATERKAARAYLAQLPPEPGPPPPRPGQAAPPPAVAIEPSKPGEKIAIQDVPLFTGKPLFAPEIMRTVFLDFEDADWNKELAEFARTDVSVPARVTLDGKSVDGAGARFLSRMNPPGEGYQRSLELTLDYATAGQNLAGSKRLTLFDANRDPTFLRQMLYYRIAREFIPTPAAEFVRTVINGENWGIYTNVQPLDENFTREQFGSDQGARWISTGGTLAYLGEDPAAYRAAYRLLSPEDPAAWKALIHLCKVLDQTPPDQFDFEVTPVLDLNGALKLLALENALMNQDGYSGPASNYGLYLDPKGVFHLVPQAASNSLRLIEVTEFQHGARGGGSGRSGGRRGGGGGGGRTRGGSGPGDETSSSDDSAPTVAVNNQPTDFPRQSNTDLAMLLSYSFVNKADVDFDRTLTKEEWLDFAKVWFHVMDEDFAGQLSHDQFIAKVRLFITPASMTDGHTRQSFGKDDPAGSIGENLFVALDANHDGQLTPDEFQTAFTTWFAAWSDAKSGRLTEDALRRGLSTILTKTVFQADQTYIASKPVIAPDEGESHGRHGGGGGAGGRGGNAGVTSGTGGNTAGLGFGPLHLGTGGGHGSGGSGGGSSVITFGEQLDPLASLDDDRKPLQAKLLAMPLLRDRYLGYIHDITDDWLTWSKLGPIAQEYHNLIASEVAKDTHKPSSYAQFVKDLDQDSAPEADDSGDAPSLRAFVKSRQSYLLHDDDVVHAATEQ